MKIDGIEISHYDKLIFPKAKITKLDMARYYEKMAGRMLPFLKDRPLTLQRFPDGIDKNGFYQKHAQDYYPDFVKRITVKTEDGEAEEIMCNNKESLIYLANQGVVTYHIWSSRKDKPDFPDKMVFDLDPSDQDFEKVKQSAKIVKDYLRSKDREAKVMTTGKSGLHVFYSMRRTKPFDQVRKEARKMAEEMVDRHSDLLTIETRKNKREDKVYVDYLRNSYGQTSVCPYSLRANPSAGVATPLEWKELDNIDAGDTYGYKNIFRRLGAQSG
ncbi:MAG TPA: non-homologous end-joining DNA ligase [Pricia sp.]|nr:non-homologous end-joining DNA ligase [Pricia sp.]